MIHILYCIFTKPETFLKGEQWSWVSVRPHFCFLYPCSCVYYMCICIWVYVLPRPHSPLSSRFLFMPLILSFSSALHYNQFHLLWSWQPLHNDSGPHNTFNLLFHTIKPHTIAWHLLTNHSDKQGLEMFFLHGILHPAGLLIIIVSVFSFVMSVLKKHFSTSPVRGFSWNISLLECLLMAC